MLAGIFAIITLMYVIELSKSKSDGLIFFLTRIALFTWLSAEAKPQFSISLIFLILSLILLQKNYLLLAPLFVVTIIPFAVLLKDKILNSPFLESANSNSPYAVVFEPASILHGLNYYVEKSFTIGTLLLFIFVVSLQIGRRQFTSLALLIGLMLSILFPLVLIPNHLLPPYGLFGTYAIAIWLTIGVDSLLEKTKDSATGRFLIAILLLTAFLFSKNVYSSKFFNFKTRSIQDDTYTKWVLERQVENSNLEKTVGTVEIKNLKNVLFGGVYGPWHLLRDTQFVRSAYPQLGKYYVYLQNSESAWNSVARSMNTGVTWSDISRLHIDWVVLVNPKGGLSQIVPWSKFKSLEECAQIAALDTGILLDHTPGGRFEYFSNQATIHSLMTANSHGADFIKLQRLFQ